jgi:hypothetical protein
MEPDPFMVFYQSLRGSLFSGFLTLTGFLFSMKTFLLANLQRDIYGTKEYQLWVEQIGRKYNPQLRVTGPIRRLARLLWWTLFATFVASISQLTIGLINHRAAAIICYALAAIAVCMVGVSIFVLSFVVKDWMGVIDVQAKERAKLEAAERAATEEAPDASDEA